MLREYRLTNFKAFGETVTIPIRPLTLIFGANSSGKSSIFQSMLLLKQTLKEAKNPNTTLWPKGSLVDLGTYRDFVHRHETERNFGFGVRFDLESGSNTGPADTSSKSEMGLLSLREQAIAILNDAGVTNAGLTFRFSYDEKKYAVAPPRIDLIIGDEPQPLISDIGRKVTTNFESAFWRQWWNNIKERFNNLLELANNAELEGKECKVGELSDILRNSSWEEILNDLEEMQGSSWEDTLNTLEEIKGSPLEDILNTLKELKRTPLVEELVEGILNDLEEIKGSSWEEILNDLEEVKGSPREEILNDLKEMKRTQWVEETLNILKEMKRLQWQEELVEEILNDLEEIKGSSWEEILNDLKEMKRSPLREELVGVVLNDLEERERSLWEEVFSDVKEIRGSQLVENVLNALKEVERPFSYAKYKNFLLESVNLFGYPPKRKKSIFNAQLYIMTNYPTEDGNTADYGDIYDRDLQEESNLSIREVVVRLCSPLPQFLGSLVYLGPLRSQPERHYEFSGDTTDYVGQSGEHLSSLLFQRPELLEQINKDLDRLDVKYQLKVSRLQDENADPSNVFSLRLVDTETKTDASLRDVGFGISQVLPIVVQSWLSENKTLLIEQPEIHLHPAHQAELGDMFIRSAKERGNTLLLETHSEHLMLRILRRIRQTTNKDRDIPEDCKICPEDVAVLYVQPGEKGAQVIEIPVTEDGDFKNPWPGGFFEESIKELF